MFDSIAFVSINLHRFNVTVNGADAEFALWISNDNFAKNYTTRKNQ